MYRFRCITRRVRLLFTGAACLAVWLSGARAAVLHIEQFTGGAPATYNGRDGVFSYVGYSGFNSFEGSFGAQTFPVPEIDAIRITDSPFFQNYATAFPAYDSFDWTFDFIAQDVAPSTFNIYFGNATDAFLYTVSLSPVIGLNSFTINLSSANWIGGPGSYSTYNFSSFTYIDIQYSRNGIGAQQFFLDNMALNGYNLGLSAIPEPANISMLGFVFALLTVIRRQLRS